MKKITIGRNTDNDIVILDQSVSGYHAELEIRDNGEMVFIDHSTNGTMVNGNHLHKDSCHVFGTDKIVFPGQHYFDWSKVEIPAQVQAAAPVQAPKPVYQQPVSVPQYQQPAPVPAHMQPTQQYQQPAQQQYYQIGDIGFVEVLTNFWKNYFNFSGRARRKEYWLMMVWNIIFSIIPFVGWLVLIAGFIGYISLVVRRLHDSGKSGLFLLLGLIPVIGGLIIFIFCCQDSERGQNKWGPSSKYITVQ